MGGGGWVVVDGWWWMGGGWWVAHWTNPKSSTKVPMAAVSFPNLAVYGSSSMASVRYERSMTSE